MGTDDRRRRRLRARPAVTLAACLLSAIATLAAIDLLWDPDQPGPMDAGSCIDWPAGPARPARPVDCDTLHDAEVFATVDLPDGAAIPWPGPDAIAERARAACDPHFTTYTGQQYESAALWIDTRHPDATGWDDGDRHVTCLLVGWPSVDHDGDVSYGQLRGSYAGPGR